jgi:hypothetical protein
MQEEEAAEDGGRDYRNLGLNCARVVLVFTRSRLGVVGKNGS